MNFNSEMSKSILKIYLQARIVNKNKDKKSFFNLFTVNLK